MNQQRRRDAVWFCLALLLFPGWWTWALDWLNINASLYPLWRWLGDTGHKTIIQAQLLQTLIFAAGPTLLLTLPLGLLIRGRWYLWLLGFLLLAPIAWVLNRLLLGNSLEELGNTLLLLDILCFFAVAPPSWAAGTALRRFLSPRPNHHPPAR